MGGEDVVNSPRYELLNWLRCPNCGSQPSNFAVYTDGSVRLRCKFCNTEKEASVDPIPAAL